MFQLEEIKNQSIEDSRIIVPNNETFSTDEEALLIGVEEIINLASQPIKIEKRVKRYEGKNDESLYYERAIAIDHNGRLRYHDSGVKVDCSIEELVSSIQRK